jgi:hypothetical protein
VERISHRVCRVSNAEKLLGGETIKETAMQIQRHTDWMRSAAPLGFLVALLGAWALFVPLVGPYFEFGFATDDTWVFSQTHWTLSLIPGLVAIAGGLLLMMPARKARLGALLALIGGVWLVVGPSLHPLWESEELAPLEAAETREALLWIGYFYGTGALISFLAGVSMGLLQRFRRTEEVVEEIPPAPEPVEEREDRTVVYR